MHHTQALRQFIILASHYLCLLLIPPHSYFTCD